MRVRGLECASKQINKNTVACTKQYAAIGVLSAECDKVRVVRVRV